MPTPWSSSTADGLESWLLHGREARLGYATGRGPRSLVVRYAVSRGRLVFRLPEYSGALGYARDQSVTLDLALDDLGRSRTGHLRVTGTARLADEESMADVEPVLDERWPDGVVTHGVSLPPRRVELVHAD